MDVTDYKIVYLNVLTEEPRALNGALSVVWCPFFICQKGDGTMKVRVTNDHCKGCLWLLKGNVCPFVRCVKRYGFTHDKGDDWDE